MICAVRYLVCIGILIAAHWLQAEDFVETWSRDHSIFPPERNFQKLVPADPNGRWNSAGLPDNIRDLKIPEQFRIEELVVARNKAPITIDLHDDILSIKTPKAIPLFSRHAFAGFQRLRIEVEVAGEGEAGIGLYAYGRFFQRTLPLLKISSPIFQKETFDYFLEKMPQASQVRIVLLAKGTIRFRNTKIFTAPLPPAWSQAEGTITALYGNGAAALVECTGFGSGSPVPQHFTAALPAPDPKSPWKTGDTVSMTLRPIAENDHEAMTVLEQNLPPEVRYHARRIVLFMNNQPSRSKSAITKTDFLPSVQGKADWGNPPLPEEKKAALETLRLEELRKVDRLIEESIRQRNQKNMAFQQDWRRTQKKYRGIGNSGLIWANDNGCFFALPRRYMLLAESRIPQEKLDALDHWNQLLAAKGITLIVQVIPHFYDVAARALLPAWRNTPDLSCAMVVKQLLERKIQAQYLSDRIVERAREGELLFGYPRSRYPLAPVWQIAVDAATERLAPLTGDFVPDRLPELFLAHSESSDLRWPEDQEVYPYQPGTPVPCRTIRYSGEKITSDPASPVLIAGDPMIAGPVDSGGYGAYFAMKMQMFPHILHCSDFNFMERMYIYSDIYGKGKHAVILPVLISDLVAPGIVPDTEAWHADSR